MRQSLSSWGFTWFTGGCWDDPGEGCTAPPLHIWGKTQWNLIIFFLNDGSVLEFTPSKAFFLFFLSTLLDILSEKKYIWGGSSQLAAGCAALPSEAHLNFPTKQWFDKLHKKLPPKTKRKLRKHSDSLRRHTRCFIYKPLYKETRGGTKKESEEADRHGNYKELVGGRGGATKSGKSRKSHSWLFGEAIP